MRRALVVVAVSLCAFGAAADGPAATAGQPANGKKFDPSRHAVISTDRADGRYVATRGVVQEMLRKTPPLSFNPSFTADQFKEWKGMVKKELRKVLAFPDLPPAPAPKLLWREKRDGYSLEKWEHYPMSGVAVPFLVLVPDGVSESSPAPAVLCLPGTNYPKESLAGEPDLSPLFAIPEKFREENAMALHYARAGIVAYAVDNPGFGELSDLEIEAGHRKLSYIEMQTLGHHLLNVGWSYMGYAAFVDHRLLEAMRKDRRIDRRRIAVSGHSLGAWMAGYLTVLNEDIVAAVINQGIYHWREAAKCMTGPAADGTRPQPLGIHYFIPGMYCRFDHPDIQAAIAPRPVLYCEGMPERDYRNIYVRAYDIAGAPQNLGMVPFAKYADASKRFAGSPPEGLPNITELYAYYSNDAPDHYFKYKVAVPWLKSKLFDK